MATKQEINRIKTLAAEGKSVNSIKSKLDLPKSTVYYHFKKEVGRKQKKNRLKIPEEKEVQGEICGIFAGDGYFKKYEDGHYTTVITLNYKQGYWKSLKQFLTDELCKEPHFTRQKSRARLKYDSKKLHDMFKDYLNWKNHSEEFKKGFLRGLIDTDGFLKKNRSFVFNSISKNLTKNVSHILTDMNIEHKVRINEDRRENCRTIYRVYLNKNSSMTFHGLVEPRHHKKKLNKQ